MLPPAAQHAMADRAGSIVTSISGSHVTLISHAPEVARVIAAAAHAVSSIDPSGPRVVEPVSSVRFQEEPMMRRLTIAAFIALTLIAIAGCSGSASSVPPAAAQA